MCIRDRYMGNHLFIACVYQRASVSVCKCVIQLETKPSTANLSIASDTPATRSLTQQHSKKNYETQQGFKPETKSLKRQRHIRIEMARINAFAVLGIIVLLLTHVACYNYYVLSSNWQGSVCKHMKCLEKEITKIVPSKFNLHGLWPSNLKGEDPLSCRHSPIHFDKLGKDINQKMERHWSGLFHSRFMFISHEWSKHGTCWNDTLGESVWRKVASKSSVMRRFITAVFGYDPEVRKQRGYIQKAIDINLRYNMFDILGRGSITPRDKEPYQVGQIRRAIAQALNITSFDLSCLSKQHEQYLERVFVCLDLHYKPIDCPKKHRRGDACDPTQSIYYPTFTRDQTDQEL
eukprot:TRINITY_DN23285_c0_g1_i3.p1 TRINITY_DN23285_c0_g1~~TRINITY_DN23285_c0_g1_i3.p1  ORF type:complete len:348 (-),score=30.23 TRINITY_DN23285_c0_g1_i3:139-1182(-)